LSKRVLFTLGATVAALIAGVAPAMAANDRGHSGTDWACVVVVQLDQGVCQQNPLPAELPVPDEARLLPPG
jgi:hypothetical protein